MKAIITGIILVLGSSSIVVDKDKMLEDKKSFVSLIMHDEIVIDYCDDERDMIAEIKETFEGGYVSNIKGGKDFYSMSEVSI